MGAVPGPEGGGSRKRGFWEVDPAGRPDAGRAGQWARPSATQPVQTPARDPDGTNVQHQLRDPGLQQQRRGEDTEVDRVRTAPLVVVWGGPTNATAEIMVL